MFSSPLQYPDTELPGEAKEYDLVEVKMLRLGLELLQQDAKRFQKSKRTKIELTKRF